MDMNYIVTGDLPFLLTGKLLADIQARTKNTFCKGTALPQTAQYFAELKQSNTKWESVFLWVAAKKRDGRVSSKNSSRD